LSRTITRENIDALREGYDILKSHPCVECSNDYVCDVCHDAREWIKDISAFIFSPLLEQVIVEFIENHSSEER